MAADSSPPTCRLSVSILRDKRLAWTSTVLYCINPASVFHSAMYDGASHGLGFRFSRKDR
jgi:hypothetical protein